MPVCRVGVPRWLSQETVSIEEGVVGSGGSYNLEMNVVSEKR